MFRPVPAGHVRHEPAYLGLAEGILALLSDGGVPPDRAAWGVDILLHVATSTAAEQGTREREIDARDEEDALAAALREAPAETFPHLAALGAELTSGAGPDRLTWGFRVLINGILQTPRPEPGTTPATYRPRLAVGDRLSCPSPRPGTGHSPGPSGAGSGRKPG
jgi:Tetracyclin repressor-like, C-terminal domain